MSTGEGQESARKRRRDFEDNRAAILEAAAAAFAEEGADVPINAIAERAGVAPATVYRHFPNRGALVQSVFEQRIDAYTAAIEQAAAIDDPAQSFRAAVLGIVELQARDRSFREIVGKRGEEVLEDPVLLRFGLAFLTLLQTARSAGVLRSEVTDEDVMLTLLATEGVARPIGQQSADALMRFAELLLDGLCAQREMPRDAPLAYEQILGITRG